MSARIYPSAQDTNTTARGSIILNYLQYKTGQTNLITLTVNSTVVNRTYGNVNYLCASKNIVNGDTFSYSLNFSKSTTYNLKVYIINYSTDDNFDYGITKTLLSNSSGTSFGFGATVTVANPTPNYNFEYLLDITLT